MGEKREGIKKYLKLSQNSCGDIKHGLRDLDNAIVITMRGARRVLETSGVTL